VKDDLPNLRPLAKWVRHGAITIQDPETAVRIDRYLSARFPYRSRTQWARVIESGRIRLNGAACRPSRVVRFGDRIDYVPQAHPEPEVSCEISILYEDDALLAVNKPPDLPVHPSGRYFHNTLLCLLLRSRGETLDTPGIRIVHRLDRETSGVVLFGKTRQATARMAAQFEAHRVAKEYLALVHGMPEEDRFRIEAAIGRNLQSKIRKAMGVVPDGEGRPAITDFEVLRRSPGGKGASGPEQSADPGHSLLRARPLTGRLHQIRVHCRHAGYPIVGDKLYGRDEAYFLKLAAGEEYSDEDRRGLLHDRQGLHAVRITIVHPLTDALFTVEAPMPADLRALCAKLGIADA